jgi:hypothetical protein
VKQEERRLVFNARILLGARLGVPAERGTMVRPSTPVIAVSIGYQTRIYHAFLTTAPSALDGPATVTLYAASFGELVGLAANPNATDETRTAVMTRLVLIDARELNWHRERYRAADHCFSPADPAWSG